MRMAFWIADFMFRGFDISRYVQKQKRGDRVYRQLFQHVDYCLANCDFFRQRVLGLGWLGDRQRSSGQGNEHDLVGRFYTDHPKHHTGVLYPGSLARQCDYELQCASKPCFCICFALDNTTQREHRRLEHVLYLKPIYEKPLVRCGEQPTDDNRPRPNIINYPSGPLATASDH